jgi:hypothetical protein
MFMHTIRPVIFPQQFLFTDLAKSVFENIPDLTLIIDPETRSIETYITRNSMPYKLAYPEILHPDYKDLLGLLGIITSDGSVYRQQSLMLLSIELEHLVVANQNTVKDAEPKWYIFITKDFAHLAPKYATVIDRPKTLGLCVYSTVFEWENSCLNPDDNILPLYLNYTAPSSHKRLELSKKAQKLLHFSNANLQNYHKSLMFSYPIYK